MVEGKINVEQDREQVVKVGGRKDVIGIFVLLARNNHSPRE